MPTDESLEQGRNWVPWHCLVLLHDLQNTTAAAALLQ
jgi:hypothetical protein